jgi:hypothetical protein
MSRIADASSKATVAGSPGSGPPLELQPGAIGVAAQFTPAVNQRRVQRRRPQQRMRRAVLQMPVEHFQARQHPPHAQDRVAPFARAAAMRGAPARLDAHPLEPLVRHRHVETGGLGNHRGVGTVRGHEGVGAETRVLLVHDGRHDDAAGRQSTALGQRARGREHGGHAALHVLRAAP